MVPSWQFQANFLVAIKTGSVSTCATFLADGADCDQMFRDNAARRPAISIAATRSTPEGYDLVELLLNAGASINLPDSNGATCLHAAVEAGSEEICRLLVQKRANLNAVNNSSVSSLHMAVRRNAGGTASLGIVRLLLANGADVNRLDTSHKSPLHYACSAPRVNEDLVHLLLAKGAVVDKSDSGGFTPFLYLLQSSSFSANMVRTFISKGARVNFAPAHTRKAPIHRIVCSRSPDKLKCLELLLQQPTVDLDAVTNDKQTALHLCAVSGEAQCTRALLRAGANPEVVNQLGSTALMNATTWAMAPWPKHTLVLLLFIQAGVRLRESHGGFKLLLEVNDYPELAQLLSTPPKLTELSRRVVWKHLRKPTEKTIKQMGASGEVPASIIPFLQFEDEF